jgi:hypothetical protein
MSPDRASALSAPGPEGGIDVARVHADADREPTAPWEQELRASLRSAFALMAARVGPVSPTSEPDPTTASAGRRA